MSVIYVGVDPAAGRAPLTYVGLSDDLQVLVRATGELADLRAALAGHAAALAAVDGPSRLNLVAPDAAQRAAGKRAWAGFRTAEFELRRRGIRVAATPAALERAPRWMRTALAAFADLRAQGFQDYQPRMPATRQALEVNANAAYTVWLGHLPYNRNMLEGRLQRQAVLYAEGLEIADPMEVVEEITRHHMLAGTLDLPGLLSPAELDALAGAYTAYLAAREPDRVLLVGQPAEGQIVVPVASGEWRELYE